MNPPLRVNVRYSMVPGIVVLDVGEGIIHHPLPHLVEPVDATAPATMAVAVEAGEDSFLPNQPSHP
jgi:hypothetical protein